MQSYDIDEIQVGMSVSSVHTVSEKNIVEFAEISGDKNPVHLDEEYAESTRFKKRIAHGLMSASYFSALFGTELPGIGCVYVSQNLKFLRPVFIGDTVTATVVVKFVDYKTRRVTFVTKCEVLARKVITGEAVLYIPPKENEIE